MCAGETNDQDSAGDVHNSGPLRIQMTHRQPVNCLSSDHWLLGEFTQNAPCKGDASDPAELRARISTDQIESKAGVCKFLDTQPEANRLKAHALCQFPAGPLIGDFTFTRKDKGIIDFVDRDGTYTAILHRGSK
jgi:hypothetical protein